MSTATALGIIVLLLVVLYVRERRAKK